MRAMLYSALIIKTLIGSWIFFEKRYNCNFFSFSGKFDALFCVQTELFSLRFRRPRDILWGRQLFWGVDAPRNCASSVVGYEVNLQVIIARIALTHDTLCTSENIGENKGGFWRRKFHPRK